MTRLKVPEVISAFGSIGEGLVMFGCGMEIWNVEMNQRGSMEMLIWRVFCWYNYWGWDCFKHIYIYIIIYIYTYLYNDTMLPIDTHSSSYLIPRKEERTAWSTVRACTAIATGMAFNVAKVAAQKAGRKGSEESAGRVFTGSLCVDVIMMWVLLPLVTYCDSYTWYNLIFI